MDVSSVVLAIAIAGVLFTIFIMVKKSGRDKYEEKGRIYRPKQEDPPDTEPDRRPDSHSAEARIEELKIDPAPHVDPLQPIEEITYDSVIEIEEPVAESEEPVLESDPDPNLDVTLSDLVLEGDVEALSAALKSGLDPNGKDMVWDPVICGAIYGDYTEIVPMLLDAGADPNTVSNIGDSLLVIAVLCESEVLVDVLINAGADLELKNELQETAFLIAVQRKNITAMKQLLDAGANINALDDSKRTPIFAAVWFDEKNPQDYNHSIVEFIIDAGADLEIQDEYEETVLMNATESNNLEAIEALLKGGAKTEAKSKDELEKF